MKQLPQFLKLCIKLRLKTTAETVTTLKQTNNNKTKLFINHPIMCTISNKETRTEMQTQSKEELRS